MKYIGMILLALLCIVLILLVIAVIRTLTLPNKVSAYQAPAADERALGYAKKLSEMIQCDTTSYDSVVDYERFAKFHTLLQKLFPLVHEKLGKDGYRRKSSLLLAGKKP